MNKKTFKRLAAALITGVMLTGCGGGNTPSTNPSTDAPTSVEVSAEPSEETSVEVSEDVPAESSEEVSEELPSEDLPSSEEVEVPPSLKYESEASLVLDFSSYAIGDKFSSGAPYTLGDFEMIVPDGKTNEVKKEDKTVTVNGVEKTYSQRINNNAGATRYTFEAERAGKLLVVARSSSKDEVEDRLAVLYNEAGSTVDTAELPGGTFDAEGVAANSPYACYEVEFDAAGYYEFCLEKYNGTGAGTHILDMLVYYVDDGIEDTPTETPSEGLTLPFYPEENTGYAVTPNGTDVNITYNGLGNTYKPVTSPDIGAYAANNNTFTATVKNNGSADSRVRFDIQGTTWVATGDGSGTDACNVSATGGDIWTDLTWGGSTLTVPANGEVTVVITYDGNGAQGPVKNLLVYVDSARGDGETYSSDITLSNMYFSNVGGEDGGEVAPTEDLSLAFYPEENTGYVATTNGTEVNITYNGLGNTYKPATAPGVGDYAAENNTFTVTITNNGSADSSVRVDLQGTTWVATGDGSGTDACNVSSTGGDSWTDTTWGGTKVTVPAGQSVTLVITYDGNGAQGPVQNILVFVDSARGDGETYSSDITLSGMRFYNA